MVAVDGNLGLADGAADVGGIVERGGMPGNDVADLAVFDWLGLETSGRNWCMLPPR